MDASSEPIALERLARNSVAIKNSCLNASSAGLPERLDAAAKKRVIPLLKLPLSEPRRSTNRSVYRIKGSCSLTLLLAIRTLEVANSLKALNTPFEATPEPR